MAFYSVHSHATKEKLFFNKFLSGFMGPLRGPYRLTKTYSESFLFGCCVTMNTIKDPYRLTKTYSESFLFGCCVTMNTIKDP